LVIFKLTLIFLFKNKLKLKTKVIYQLRTIFKRYFKKILSWKNNYHNTTIFTSL